MDREKNIVHHPIQSKKNKSKQSTNILSSISKMVNYVKNKRKTNNLEGKKDCYSRLDNRFIANRKHTFTAFRNSRSKENLASESFTRISTAKKQRNIISPNLESRKYELNTNSIDQRLPQLSKAQRVKATKRYPSNLKERRK